LVIIGPPREPHGGKAPNLHFVDSGLACRLLGVRTPEQLRVHPLRGAVFESWVASDVLKARVHRARPADLFLLREVRGAEVDLIVEDGMRVRAVEAKSGATIPWWNQPGADFPAGAAVHFRDASWGRLRAGSAAPHVAPGRIQRPHENGPCHAAGDGDPHR
jgi:hypothetical protein